MGGDAIFHFREKLQLVFDASRRQSLESEMPLQKGPAKEKGRGGKGKAKRGEVGWGIVEEFKSFSAWMNRQQSISTKDLLMGEWLDVAKERRRTPSEAWILFRVLDHVCRTDDSRGYMRKAGDVTVSAVTHFIKNETMTPTSSLTTNFNRMLGMWAGDRLLKAPTLEKLKGLIQSVEPVERPAPARFDPQPLALDFTGSGSWADEVEQEEMVSMGSATATPSSCASSLFMASSLSAPISTAAPAAEVAQPAPAPAPQAPKVEQTPQSTQTEEVEISIKPDTTFLQRMENLELIVAKQNEIITKQHKKIVQLNGFVKELRQDMLVVKQTQQAATAHAHPHPPPHHPSYF